MSTPADITTVSAAPKLGKNYEYYGGNDEPLYQNDIMAGRRTGGGGGGAKSPVTTNGNYGGRDRTDSTQVNQLIYNLEHNLHNPHSPTHVHHVHNSPKSSPTPFTQQQQHQQQQQQQQQQNYHNHSNVPLGHRPYQARITDTDSGLLIESYKPKCQVNSSPIISEQPRKGILSSPKHVVHNQPTTSTASNATQELDDLMASLSDFKMKDRPMSNSDYGKVVSPKQLTAVTTPGSHQLDSIIGSLQSDMSRHGVDTAAKGHCSACHKPIVGQVVTALGKTWHPEHFTCLSCGLELGTKNFFERDGNPYCETDYHKLFSPKCAYCSASILDKCITALERTWHPEHFFCAHCGKTFGDDGYHEKNGKPYCRQDYFDLFAPKCGGCNAAITDNYISALNTQWHPECFVCRDCRSPFQGGSFFDHEGQPYCETHYHAKRGSLCAGCHKPIAGRCITAMYRKFHPEHFVCVFCLKQLNKGTFKEQNDKPYCHPCFEKLFA
ncbi:leupaxin-like isoform X2 [Oppia nitens]|nr:leupaxin-like isoform X2 [Oppia nitens]